jgi:hypothetical protein
LPLLNPRIIGLARRASAPAGEKGVEIAGVVHDYAAQLDKGWAIAADALFLEGAIGTAEIFGCGRGAQSPMRSIRMHRTPTSSGK